MEAHAGYCHMKQDNEAARRRHNNMVYRYMMMPEPFCMRGNVLRKQRQR